MEAQNESGHLVFKSKFCLCNQVKHFFLSDPVIIFDCCCPEAVPAGPFCLEIAEKPTVLHFKPPLSDNEVVDSFLNLLALKSVQYSQKLFPNNEFCQMNSDTDMDPETQEMCATNSEDVRGEECLEDDIPCHEMADFPAVTPNETICCNTVETVAAEQEQGFRTQSLDSEASDLSASMEMLELGPQTYDENIMKILDYVFRDMDSSQLDRTLAELSSHQRSDEQSHHCCEETVNVSGPNILLADYNPFNPFKN